MLDKKTLTPCYVQQFAMNIHFNYNHSAASSRNSPNSSSSGSCDTSLLRLGDTEDGSTLPKDGSSLEEREVQRSGTGPWLVGSRGTRVESFIASVIFTAGM